MQDSSGGRGGTRPGAGRRPRYGSPMSRTAFTARPDQVIFYWLLSGNQKTVSAGVQTAVAHMVKLDPEAAQLHEQAKWMATAAEKELTDSGKPARQEDVLRLLLDHTERFVAMYEARGEN